ncbi:MFS transporter [Streptomyces badius]
MVSGFAAAIWWAVGILVAAAVIAIGLINTGRPGTGTGGTESASGGGAEETDAEFKIPVVAH